MKFVVSLRALLLTTLLASAAPTFALVVPVAEDTSSNESGFLTDTTGKAGTLTVSNVGQRIVYLRFHVSDFNIVHSSLGSANLASAVVHLFITRNETPGIIAVQSVSSPWSENVSGRRDPKPGEGLFINLLSPNNSSSRQFMSIDVSQAAAAALDAGTDLEIALIPTRAPISISFSSKETRTGGMAPFLDLEARPSQDSEGNATGNSLTLTGTVNAANGIYSGPVATSGLQLANYSSTITIGNEVLLHDTRFGGMFFGLGAGNPGFEGKEDTAIGDHALAALKYGDRNTAVGSGALKANTEGSYNNAFGVSALGGNVSGDQNIAIGSYALSSSNTADDNVAIGYSALYQTTTGFANVGIGTTVLNRNTTGSLNVAIGKDALAYNTTGSSNTAVGNASLRTLSIGSYNTALGDSALFAGSTCYFNTALGFSALLSTTSGGNNTGVGSFALAANTVGSRNIALGESAMRHYTQGFSNTAIGFFALCDSNSVADRTGSFNIALGSQAGSNLTGSYNIAIGNEGVAGDNNTIRLGTQGTHSATYLAGIYGSTAASGVAVYVDANGHLGTLTSSARFKREIHPMAADSEALLALQPVSFRYQSALDPTGTPQFGLIAEQVEKVDPQLVAHDEKGGIYTVRYEAVNAMLLNEFLKEHRRVQHQGETIASQQKQIGDLTTQLATIQAQLDKLAHRLGEPTAPNSQPTE